MKNHVIQPSRTARLSLSEEQRDSSGSGTGTAADGGASPLVSTCYIDIF